MHTAVGERVRRHVDDAHHRRARETFLDPRRHCAERTVVSSPWALRPPRTPVGDLAPHRSAVTLVPAGILVFSDRPALHAFFTTVSPASERASVTLEAARTASLDGLGAAIVDVALEPAIGIEVCTELHRRRDDLPVAAVVCCPHAVN